MENIRKASDDTKVIHGGIGEYEYGPVVPPIYQVSTFKFEDVDHGARLFKSEEKGYIYTRMGNPTIEALENSVAILENGDKALACSSGMAAVHTVLASVLKTGDHVVCSEAVYGPTNIILRTLMTKFGIESTFVDTSNLEHVKKAIKPNTTLIYVESPGNPTLVVSDIEAIAKIAKENNALLCVDNTFMSPILQKPLELGANIVLHSMTKYLNGHADVVAGIVIVNDDLYPKFRKTLNLTGGVIDPFNAFLVHRGIKTLYLRVWHQSKSAEKIAAWLEKQPQISWIKYPGLKSHPQHDIAMKQQKAPGSMISFGLEGGLEAGKRMMNNVHLCQLAVSLGGVESLIQHPASMTHAGMTREDRLAGGITDGLVRVSVGIENVDDILGDLKHALKQV